MNLKFMGFLGIIFLLIIGVLVFFLLRMIFKERDDPQDNPILENYIPQYSKGYTDGVVDKIDKGEERSIVWFYPRDIKYIKLKKRIGIIKPIPLIAHNKFIEFFSEGEFSMHRNKIKVYPEDIKLLPERIKNSTLTAGIVGKISEQAHKVDEIEVWRNRVKSQNKILEKSDPSELALAYKEKADKDFVDRRELALPHKKEGEK